MKTRGKSYHARNAKPLISGWLQLFVQMFKIYLFLFYQEYFRSEIVNSLLRIILESFKLHYFFLTSNTCDEYLAVQTQIRSDASNCFYNKQSLTWMPESFDAWFPVSFNSL